MSLTLLFAALTLFLGAFTQSLTGFGSALVAMALLPALLGLETAAPLVAATGLALETMMTLRYRQHLRLDAIWRVLVASLAAAPLGVLLLPLVDERIALLVLGIIIVGYALYALVGFRLPTLAHPAWAWTAGILSGLLGGEYNTSGPPVILYGNCRNWDAGQFKSNLSGFFVINSLFVTASHLVKGSYTGNTTQILLLCLPFTLLGFIAGQFMDRWLDPIRFRRIVLFLLAALGIRLMFG